MIAGWNKEGLPAYMWAAWLCLTPRGDRPCTFRYSHVSASTWNTFKLLGMLVDCVCASCTLGCTWVHLCSCSCVYLSVLVVHVCSSKSWLFADFLLRPTHPPPQPNLPVLHFLWSSSLWSRWVWLACPIWTLWSLQNHQVRLDVRQMFTWDLGHIAYYFKQGHPGMLIGYVKSSCS